MVKTKSNIVSKDGTYITGSTQGLDVKSSFAQIITLPRIFVGTEIVPIPHNIPCVYFEVRAPRENTDPIYVRGIGNDANNTADQRGILIYPGELRPVLLENTNLGTLISPGTNQIALITVYPDTDNTLQNVNYEEPPIPDSTPPTISSIVPADTATDIERNADITVTFSEAIDSDTIDDTNFAITGTGVPTISKFRDPSNTSKMIGRPLTDYAATTVYTVTISGIKDLAGNTIVGSSVTTFTTKAGGPGADVTPPTITSKTPDTDTTNAERSVDVVIVFSEAMNAADGASNTKFTLAKTSTGAVVPCVVSLGVDQQTVTMNPTTDLEYGTQYTVTVLGSTGGVRDLAGNLLAATTTWNFSTRPATLTTIYNVANDGNTTEMGAPFDHYIGTEINTTSHPLYNHNANVVKVRVRKINTPPGNIECWILDSSRNELRQIGIGILANSSSITSSSSSSSEITFTDNTLTSSNKFTVGQFLCIKYDQGSSTNRIRIMDCDVGTLANAYSVQIPTEGASPDRNTSSDWAATVQENS